ncbi:MAG: tetratricopeptide repeat protein [Phycisphaerales bacterium]|nr:tetratricopeptide repeat protein [Phycisphaerales bacterium]
MLRSAALLALAVAASTGAPAIGQSADGANAPSLPVPQPIPTAHIGDRPRIAIIDFAVAADTDPRDAWMGDAITEQLSYRLRRHPRLLAVSTERLNQARAELAEDANPPAWPAVAKALGVRFLIRGTAAGQPDAMRLSIELHDLADETAAPRTSDLPGGRLFDVLDSATRWSLDAFRVGPPEGGPPLFGPPCKTPSALEFYVKALRAFRDEKPRATADLLRDSLDFDPAFRPALLLQAEVDLRVGAAAARRAAAARLALLAELSRKADDALDRVAVELAHGVLNGMEGAVDAAQTRFANALTIARESRDPYAQLAAMTSLANLYLTQRPPREFDDARRATFTRETARRSADWQEAVALSLEQLDDIVSLAPAFNKLALTYERCGDNERSLAMHLRMLETARQLKSRRTEATALLLLAQCHARNERWDDALAAIERCAAITPSEAAAAVSATRAAVLRGLKRPREALSEYQSALKRLRSSDDLGNQLICLREAAGLHWDLGESTEARKLLQEAIDIARALGSPIVTALEDTMAVWNEGAAGRQAPP